MKVPTRFAVVGFVCVATTLAMAVTTSPAYGASPNPTVTVVNTATNPVPVTGTVTSQVTGTVKIDSTGNTVKATQNGDWGVTVEPGTDPLEVTVVGGSLNQSAAQLVVLERSFPNWLRVFPDGTTSVFSVPSGHLLVITDIEWESRRIHSVGEERPGDIVYFAARLNGHQLFQSAATVHQDDVAGGSEHFSTGVPVASLPGFELRLGNGLQAGNQAFDGSIQGYLVAE